MKVPVKRTVIGLTGAFGSGCTTAAKFLRDERGFEFLRLSDLVRDEWKRLHGDGSPSRPDLQRVGDDLREGNGAEVLVQSALEQLGEESPRVAVDGIRNPSEVAALRRTFGLDFTLVAVLAAADERWTRIGQAQYTDLGLGHEAFLEDDEKDRNEEVAYGQAVELCIDVADVFVNNSGCLLDDFKAKMLDFTDLLTGDEVRPPSQDEILMHMAYSASHTSKCLKRHVGAVVADDRNQVVAAGYNENPFGTKPCVEEPSYDYSCFRDIIRNQHFEQLGSSGGRCPRCGEPIVFEEGPPWRCSACAESGTRTNLERYFFPDRAMSWCTAVHAEVMAVLAAGDRARGSTLFTTTFPCFQCAEKIAQAGVSRIVFSEAYPDPYSADRLELAGIDFEQFEGVRSYAFERIFSSLRPL